MLRISLSIAAIALAGPALAQATPDAAAAPAATATPAKAQVAAGAKVVDTAGADVGTIESVTNGVATLSTGTHRAGIPIASFAPGDGKLVLALTRAQVDAQGAPITADHRSRCGGQGFDRRSRRHGQGGERRSRHRRLRHRQRPAFQEELRAERRCAGDRPHRRPVRRGG